MRGTPGNQGRATKQGETPGNQPTRRRGTPGNQGSRAKQGETPSNQGNAAKEGEPQIIKGEQGTL